MTLKVGDRVEHAYAVNPEFVGITERVPGSTAAKAVIRGRIKDLMPDGGVVITVTESNHVAVPEGSTYPLSTNLAQNLHPIQ